MSKLQPRSFRWALLVRCALRPWRSPVLAGLAAAEVLQQCFVKQLEVRGNFEKEMATVMMIAADKAGNLALKSAVTGYAAGQ